MERYVIHVTKECNCDCLYCYEDDKVSRYDWEEVKELIDRLIENRTSDSFGVEFLGGEPMMAWDLIRKSYEYLEKSKCVTVEDYIITTNGTILSKESADYISKNPKMVFAVSLDGHPWANQLRVFKKSRVNTYEKAMENIKHLRELGVDVGVHMVTHPYNVSSISSSISHFYNNGIKFVDIGTIEKTIAIDERYCDRFISELDNISERIISGEFPGLQISLFNSLKPRSDVRSYIIDPKTGKTIAESYGRSGEDLTHSDVYEVNRCTKESDVSNMIYYIRETVYNMHQRRLKEVNDDN